MKRSRMTLLGCLGIFFAMFVVTYVLYGRIQVWNGPAFGFGLAIDDRVPATVLSLLVATYAVVAYAVFALGLALPLKGCRIVFASYVLALCIVLFGKSIGVSGLSLDLFRADAISAGTFLNIAVFVPIGFYTQLRIKNSPKTMLLGIGLVMAVEIVQYAFKLGIADVVDVVANTSGIAMGLALCLLMQKQGWGFSVSDERVKLVRTGEGKLAIWQKVALASGCCLFICAGLIFVYHGDASDESAELLDPNTVPLLEIESDVLLELNRAECDSEESYLAQGQVPDFEFGNGEDSGDWMRAREGGGYASEGTVDQVVAWRNESGRDCLALTVCCRDLVGDIAVVHGLPMVVTDETVVTVDGVLTNIDELRSRAYDLLTCYVTCTFSIEEGWLLAEELSVATAVAGLPDDIALFNYFRYDDYLEAVENSEPFLKLSNGQTQEIWGHLVSATGIEGESEYCTVQFYDKLGSAPVAHSVNVECPEEVPAYPAETDSLSKLAIKKEKGKLVLAG